MIDVVGYTLLIPVRPREGSLTSMINHTLSAYDKQLKALTHSVVEMGRHVQGMIRLAERCLQNPNAELVEQTRAADKEVNALNAQIEQQITVVLALQNPMAVDLRFVTTSLKIAGSLERAGDLAKNIAKRSLKISTAAPPKVAEKLHQMVEIVVAMLDEALASVETLNLKKASAVWRRDDEVDDLYHDIMVLVQQEMLADPNHIQDSTHLLFAAKNIERIADYAASVAKSVHYVSSGKPADKATLRADPGDDGEDAPSGDAASQ